MDHSGGGNWWCGGCACLGTGGIWGTSVPSPRFCCEPKTAPKYKVLIKKIIWP